MPHRPSYYTVFVENTGVSDTLCQANQTICKVARIDQTACQAQSAEGVAKMGGISGKQEPADSKLFGAALMDFVGRDVVEFVVAWLWMTGQHDLIFHGLSFD